MGLDMMLYKRPKNSKGFWRDENQHEAWPEICYWRKANAVLNWFDHNLKSVEHEEGEDPWKEDGEEEEPVTGLASLFDRNGVKNNRFYRVEREEYQRLIDDCERALSMRHSNRPVPACLKPVSGFFFGSTQMDEYYWEYLAETAKDLKAAEKDIDWDNEDVLFYISY